MVDGREGRSEVNFIKKESFKTKIGKTGETKMYNKQNPLCPKNVGIN